MSATCDTCRRRLSGQCDKDKVCTSYEDSELTCGQCHYNGDNDWCYLCEEAVNASDPACKEFEYKIFL